MKEAHLEESCSSAWYEAGILLRSSEGTLLEFVTAARYAMSDSSRYPPPLLLMLLLLMLLPPLKSGPKLTARALGFGVRGGRCRMRSKGSGAPLLETAPSDTSMYSDHQGPSPPSFLSCKAVLAVAVVTACSGAWCCGTTNPCVLLLVTKRSIIIIAPHMSPLEEEQEQNEDLIVVIF